MHNKIYNLINKVKVLNYNYSDSTMYIDMMFNVILDKKNKLDLCDIVAKHNLPSKEIYTDSYYTVFKSESRKLGYYRFELVNCEDYQRFKAELVIPRNITKHKFMSLYNFLKDFFE